MRYSRMEQQRPEEMRTREGGRSGVAFLLAVLAIAAAIYFLGAAKIGKFLGDKVFAPVFSFVANLRGGDAAGDAEGSAGAEPSQSTTGAGEEFTLTLPGLHVYALQAGAYAEEQNAAEYAASLQSKGGAGYIYKEDDICRVFIAAYTSREDAENVQKRLESEQQISTKVYEIAAEEQALRVTADAQTRADLEALTGENFAYAANLIELAMRYDRGEVTAAAVEERMAELAAQAKKQQAEAKALAKAETQGNYPAAAQVYFAEILQILETDKAGAADAEVSARIKHAYMAAAFAERTFLQQAANA